MVFSRICKVSCYKISPRPYPYHLLTNRKKKRRKPWLGNELCNTHDSSHDAALHVRSLFGSSECCMSPRGAVRYLRRDERLVCPVKDRRKVHHGRQDQAAASA